MNRIIVTVFLLLSCIAAFIAGHSAQAAVNAQAAGSGTPTPTATAGTPVDTATATPVPSETATTTLMPLPAITLIFPAPSETSTPAATPVPIVGTQTPNPAGGLTISPLSPHIRLLVGLIIVLWLILAGFVVVYLRQVR